MRLPLLGGLATALEARPAAVCPLAAGAASTPSSPQEANPLLLLGPLPRCYIRCPHPERSDSRSPAAPPPAAAMAPSGQQRPRPGRRGPHRPAVQPPSVLSNLQVRCGPPGGRAPSPPPAPCLRSPRRLPIRLPAEPAAAHRAHAAPVRRPGQPVLEQRELHAGRPLVRPNTCPNVLPITGLAAKAPGSSQCRRRRRPPYLARSSWLRCAPCSSAPSPQAKLRGMERLRLRGAAAHQRGRRVAGGAERQSQRLPAAKAAACAPRPASRSMPPSGLYCASRPTTALH